MPDLNAASIALQIQQKGANSPVQTAQTHKFTICLLVDVNTLLFPIMKDDLKTFRFNFHATIGQFLLNTPNISSPLVATWKRSSESVSSSVVQMAGGKASFSQTLTMPLNMYFDQGKGTFQDKKTLFTFNMNTPKGDKQAGVVYVEVAQILNNKLASFSDCFVLEKCPVKDSKVNITIVAELVGQGTLSDTMSVDSSILMNQSSGPSTLSIESKKNIPLAPEPEKSQKKEQQPPKQENTHKGELVEALTTRVNELTLENERLRTQLDKTKKRQHNGDTEALKEELLKSKSLQEKLESEITNLRSENIQHERQLQKMRLRMEQIYQLLFNNLNSLY